MQTRTLGRTDLRMSEITLGTWGLGSGSYGSVRPERFDETLRAAVERGVNTFDTAPVWGDAEERIGAVLEETKADALVITRGGARLVDGRLQQSFGTEELVADCEASLERLGREAIDLWLLHSPGDVTLGQDGWREAIERLEEDGKIRAWGVSVGDAEEARLAIDAGAQAICITFNLLAHNDLEDLADGIDDAGCGVLARSPLMYGMLAGRWAAGRRFAEDDHRYRRWHRGAFEERVRQVDALRYLVGPDHPDLATAALRFVLGQRTVTTAVLGARNPYQLGSAVDAADGPPYLSDDDLRRLAKVRVQTGI